MQRKVEFFYFIGSTYSYLSVTRAEAVATQEGIELVWRPFSVRTLMREQHNVPFATNPVKMSYMWRDLERRAARFSVPFNGIPPYPIDPNETANHVATLAAREGWCREFTQSTYRTWFLEKLDPGTSESLRSILKSLGRDADDCLSRAGEDKTKQEYLASTERARRLGLFGSPTFVVGEEIFWGDDRLDDALAWCKAQAPGGAMAESSSRTEYLVISRGQWDESASRDEVQRAIDAFYVWYEQGLEAGFIKRGSRLAPAGKVVSRSTVIDGPFAEAKELVGGFWFIIAPSLEEAAALAAQNPCLAYGLSLELRPLEAERARADAQTNETPAAWRRDSEA